MRMGAIGTRGEVLTPREGNGLSLAVRTDALWVRMESDAVASPKLEASRADVTRLRLVLEGSRSFEVGAGATLTPSVEMGVRHDGGDAETGTGIELGARVRYAAGPLSIEGALRTLVAHEESGYEEWGASGLIRIDPGPTGRGLMLRLTPAWGSVSNGTERLWSLADAGGLATDTDSEAKSRLDAELGYGVGLSHARGVVTPYAGLSLANGGQRVPGRCALERRASSHPGPRGEPRRGKRRPGTGERPHAPRPGAVVDRENARSTSRRSAPALWSPAATRGRSPCRRPSKPKPTMPGRPRRCTETVQRTRRLTRARTLTVPQPVAVEHPGVAPRIGLAPVQVLHQLLGGLKHEHPCIEHRVRTDREREHRAHLARERRDLLLESPPQGVVVRIEHEGDFVAMGVAVQGAEPARDEVARGGHHAVAEGFVELKRRAPSHDRPCGLRTRFGRPAMVGELCRGSITARFALGATSQFALPASRGRGSKLTSRTGGHQAGCGRNRSVARSSAVVARASESSRRGGDRGSHIGGHGRSAGGEDRAYPVFHPNLGEAQQIPVSGKLGTVHFPPRPSMTPVARRVEAGRAERRFLMRAESVREGSSLLPTSAMAFQWHDSAARFTDGGQSVPRAVESSVGVDASHSRMRSPSRCTV